MLLVFMTLKESHTAGLRCILALSIFIRKQEYLKTKISRGFNSQVGKRVTEQSKNRLKELKKINTEMNTQCVYTYTLTNDE